MEEQLERIKQKITIGGLSLGPVLPEREVAAFENRHSVTLPDGYRRFLREVGNGGDGPPYYGLARLGEAASDMPDSERRTWTKLDMLDQDFPFSKPWIWEGEEGMWDDKAHDWSDEGRAKLAQVERGNICLGNDGCGAYWHLIVVGPERGNVWLFCGEGIQPTVPRRNFLCWYEDWLDGVRNWWESE
jgi:hypothetical protein